MFYNMHHASTSGDMCHTIDYSFLVPVKELRINDITATYILGVAMQLVEII